MNDFYRDHFKKERIFHGNGAGFFGKLIIENDISTYTSCKLFKNKEVNALIRFSSTASQHGTPEGYRDTRGFSVRLFDDKEIFDIVGLNFPINYNVDRDGLKDFHSSQQRSYNSGIVDLNYRWDWFSKHPGSLHQISMTWSERGIPLSWRHMNGYGVNTLSFINSEKERFWIKIHFKTQQGIKCLTDYAAALSNHEEPNFMTADMYNSIINGNFPKWDMYIQVIEENKIDDLEYNPFRLNNVWPQSEYPLIKIGVLELNSIKAKQLFDIETLALSPSNIPEGVGLSPDGALLDRVIAYPLVQRSRLLKDVNPLSEHVKKEIKKFIAPENFYKQERKPKNEIHYFTKKFWNMLNEEKKNEIAINLSKTLFKVHPNIVSVELKNIGDVSEEYRCKIQDQLALLQK